MLNGFSLTVDAEIPTELRMQVAISQILSLTSGSTSDMRQVKADIRELKDSARNTEASIDEILRLLRGTREPD